jgi:oligopeptidase B
MAPLAGLREELYQEMLSHMKQTDVSVPFRDGDWWYYTRTEEGRQYAIHCRKPHPQRLPHPRFLGKGGRPRTEDAGRRKQVILDGNQLAEGHAFFAIGATDITDDGRWLAYTTDTTGFRQYTLHIKDLETGETLSAKSSASAPSSGPRTIARSSTPSRTRSRSASTSFGGTRCGTPHAEDVLVYQDDDERFNLGAGRTRDGKFW